MRSLIEFINENEEDIDGYVYAKDSTTNEEFFIGFSKIYYSQEYGADFTEAKRNNFRRVKIFKSKEQAEEFINKYKDKISSYSSKVVKGMVLIPYLQAKELFGDGDARQQRYKEIKEITRKNNRIRRYELTKEDNKKLQQKYKEKNPGTYIVEFPIAGNRFDTLTIVVDAESINDAFEKAKDKALRRNPNYGISGYDRRLTFTKKYIRMK